MDDNPYDKDWVCLDDLMFYHRYDLPTPDTDEIYPRDSASNSGIEGYTLFNDGSHDFDGFGHPSFPKKPTINPMKRKRSASENSEDSQGIEETENTPPNFRNVPQDLVHYHPKKPRHTRKGTVTQGKYFDGRFKLFGDRRLLLELTRYTVRPDWGTAYPCYVKNLASYQRRPKRTRKTPLSNEEATTKLVKFLSEDVKRGTREHAAIHRLANGMQLVEWGPDLILKAFDDLDLVFFRGVLATRTQIDYMNEEDIFKDRDPGISILGSCLSLGFGRCHIVLNATRIFSSHDPFAQMWNTILHEMVVSGNSFEMYDMHGLTALSMVISTYSATVLSPQRLICGWEKIGAWGAMVIAFGESLRRSTGGSANTSTCTP